MHGRLKVRTTAEQELRKKLEREKKLELYKLAMSACLDRIKTNNYDLSGIKLSEDILASNGEVQTLWNFRKNIIESYEKNKRKMMSEESDENLSEKNNAEFENEMINLLKGELFMTEIALKKNPKSYGSWYHREWCLSKANDLNLSAKSSQLSWKHELELCNTFLNSDERNFHCWKHRYFVVKKGNISRLAELDFTYEKICSNFSNYSSWHYRSKLIEKLYYENQIDADIFKKELSLIENAVFTDPNDQSAWIYEKWLLQEHQRSLINQVSFDTTTSRLQFNFAQETNLNNDLLHLKLNDIYVRFDASSNKEDKSFKWVNKNGETSQDSIVWNYELLNVQDVQTKAKIKNMIELLENDQNYLRVEIIVRNSGVSNDFLLERSKSQKKIFEFISKFDLKNIRLSNDLIEGHLKNVIELSKLEMDKSKWCLLTMIELMSMNSFSKYKATIFENLEKLANEIDPYRKNFYLDLKQKVISNNS